jgi:hypothetical protein
MADQKRNKGSEESAEKKRMDDELSGDPHQEKNEWLRDQVGEDHNLSGSSTFRTLPDQPESDEEDQSDDRSDSGRRQSNQ